MIELSVYLKSKRKPIQFDLPNTTILHKFETLLYDDKQFVTFGQVTFAKSEFIMSIAKEINNGSIQY